MRTRKDALSRKHAGIGALCGALIVATVVSGCGDRMHGTFADDDGIGSLDFQNDGRVYITMLDMTVVGEYEIDGDQVIIHGPRGAQVFVRQGESLRSGLGMTFVRQ